MIRNRLKRLEALAAAANLGRCAACVDAPRTLMIDSEKTFELFDRRMREREQRCTCGRTFHVKVITIRRGVAA